jgi:hypothetical protein
MSWGTCYSGSNNIHFDFPPMMSDGRTYAGYIPEAVINNQIIQKNNIKTNAQYRQYLTHNADNIIYNNQVEACNQCGNCVNQVERNLNNNTPFLYSSPFDKTQPFGYQESDLKNVYLSRQQLQSRKIAPFVRYNN